MAALSRRDSLKLAGAAGLLAGLPGNAFAARAATERRLVVVILRGGLDGLSLLPAVGDPDFADLRGRLAASPAHPPLRLDDLFALHGRMRFLHDSWQAGELAVLHATHTVSRNRSHFDAQDLLELGLESLSAHADGWLNRALAGLPAAPGRAGFSTGYGTPLILRGATPTGSWAPRRLPQPSPDFLDRLARMGGDDAALRDTLRQGIADAARQQRLLGADAVADRPVTGNGRDIIQLARATGRLLSEEGGARIATFSVGGWDTHGYQNIALDYRLPLLDTALGELRSGLGAAWKDSMVLVVTEFGRTAVPNGTNGTDHGTAGAALALGGAVAGGRSLGAWPGLADLHEGRDLKPTSDLRSLFKAALVEHMRLDPAFVEGTVFPDGGHVPALAGLART